MSAVTCIFNRDGTPANTLFLNKMMAAKPERGPDGQDSLLIGHVALGHQHFWMTPEEWAERQPMQMGHCTLSSDARLDNRAQLSRLLGLEREQAQKLSDAALILLSYLEWGVDCLQHFLGDFAFILWDDRHQQLFMARDALGAFDICYFIDQNLCLAASEASQILAHPSVQPRANDNKVAAMLAYLNDSHDESYFENIHYLPPAHGMIVSAEQVKLWRYWDVDPNKSIHYGDDQQYADHYLELLTEAVRCRLRTVGPVGISLSGGLDSAALAAIAAPLLPQMVAGQERLVSFSYVFDELSSCDERQYIRPLVQRYNIDAAYLPCDDKWPLKDLSHWPTSPDFVYADPYLWLPATVMAAAQASGIRLLLGGYYGDTLFSGGRYWALGMIRRLRFGLLLDNIVSNHDAFDPWSTLFEDGLRQLLPRKLARTYRRWRPRTGSPYSAGLHPDLLARTDLLQRLSFEQPLDKLTAPAQARRYRDLISSVFSLGSAAGRHRYNRHGLELAVPYYDRRLVEFVMAVPAEELGRPNETRRIHRNAMKNILPEALLSRPNVTDFAALRNKGLLDREKETIQQILTDPLIVQRRYIDPEWLQEQKQKDLDQSPGAIMLWTAISLELWLQKYWS